MINGIKSNNYARPYSYHGLVYTDGKSLAPSKISLKLYTFPLENYISSVIVIEAINTGKLFNIMTCSGTIIHRLNASNLKITTKPVYRKRDHPIIYKAL